MGIIAWNLGVIKTYKGKDDMLRFIHESKQSIPEEVMDIIMGVVKRKRKLLRAQLSYFVDIDFSESLEFLVQEPSESEIKQFLIDKALDIGVSLAPSCNR